MSLRDAASDHSHPHGSLQTLHPEGRRGAQAQPLGGGRVDARVQALGWPLRASCVLQKGGTSQGGIGFEQLVCPPAQRATGQLAAGGRRQVRGPEWADTEPGCRSTQGRKHYWPLAFHGDRGLGGTGVNVTLAPLNWEITSEKLSQQRLGVHQHQADLETRATVTQPRAGAPAQAAPALPLPGPHTPPGMKGLSRITVSDK